MRSNNPLLDAAQDISGNTNPSLDVEAPPPTITPLTGIAKLKQKPPKYSDIYKVNGKSGSSGSVSSTNTGSLSNPPEYSSKVNLDHFSEKRSTIGYNYICICIERPLPKFLFLLNGSVILYRVGHCVVEKDGLIHFK